MRAAEGQGMNADGERREKIVLNMLPVMDEEDERAA